MAEIKIEKKKPIWPWILIALLALAAILYFFVLVDNDEDYIDDDMEIEQVMDQPIEEVVEDDTIDEEAVANFESTVTKYSEYIGNKSKMGIDHEYSHGALNYLIDAVEAKANVLDVNIKADLDQARENAKRITIEPYAVNHADLIKNSGRIITRAFTTLQNAKYPNLKKELNVVNQSVESITKESHTLNQKGDVNTFFKASEVLLQKMN